MNAHAFFIIVILAVSGSLKASAIEKEPGKIAFFEKSIRPLLAKHCYKCHSAAKGEDKGGLTLDTQSGWMDGGDSGPALVPGKVSESLIIEAVEQHDPDFAMPPKYKLSDLEIVNLKKWVAMGAPDPRDGKPAKAAPSAIDIAAGRKFWSFQPVIAPVLPEAPDHKWVNDPIDRFILAKQGGKGIVPVSDADRETLIRRVTYDLVGLPPTPEEIRAFREDPASDREALARIVDRLLASEHFGERWARHWLDIVRYGESMGRTRNFPFPYAWKYRDYVIAAFNKDKPYDRFLTEQLAGDLLPDGDAEAENEAKIATGFLALGSMDLNERDKEKFKLDVIDDQIDVTGRAFMALTTGCARCHDHKFDPIPTTDYYAMAGIFGSTDTLSGYGSRQGGGNKMNRAALISLKDPESSRPVVVEVTKPGAREIKLQKQLTKLKKEQGQLIEALKNFRKANQGGAGKVSNDSETPFNAQRAQQRIKQIKGQVNRLQKQVNNLANERKQGAGLSGNLAMGVRDSKTITNCKVRIRGDADNHGAEVARGVPQVLTKGKQPDLSKDSSGRLELARWLSNPSHPLTARVMVNRVWHHLFGTGIVRTVDNFGQSGERPSHPELLDHLAARFTGEMNWSVKKLIRAMMLSHSYRLASEYRESNHAMDPDNRLFWRANVRRLEAEALRDAMMLVAGNLKLEPAEGSLVEKIKPGEIGRNSSAPVVASFSHRSVYLPIVRNYVPEFLQVFDFAEPASVIGRRDITTVSTQALYLLNDQFVIDQSRAAAKRLLNGGKLAGYEEQINGAYLLALGRSPSGSELTEARRYIESASENGQSKVEALGGMIQALFASAEFRYAL
ncbi:MAG: DUF1553 domain-containing protein [Verrucomicrobiota bacterium]|nr:DUF1553 domain-containing protein [Verrucomicrobiota bacterium]